MTNVNDDALMLADEDALTDADIGKLFDVEVESGDSQVLDAAGKERLIGAFLRGYKGQVFYKRSERTKDPAGFPLYDKSGKPMMDGREPLEANQDNLRETQADADDASSRIRKNLRLDSLALDGIDADGYCGKIMKGGVVIGRIDIGDDGKAMVFVGDSGDVRVNGRMGRPFGYSDDDAPDMVDALFAPSAASEHKEEVQPPDKSNGRSDFVGDNKMFNRRFPMSVKEAVDASIIEKYYRSSYKENWWRIASGPDTSRSFRTGTEALEYYYAVVVPRDKESAEKEAAQEKASNYQNVLSGKAWAAYVNSKSEEAAYVDVFSGEVIKSSVRTFRQSVFDLDDKFSPRDLVYVKSMGDLYELSEMMRKIKDTEQPTAKPNERKDFDQAMTYLTPFLSGSQFKAIKIGAAGEEAQYFYDKMVEMADLVRTMPKTYEQDGKGGDAVAYLHYFKGGGDWYITEKDKGGGDVENMQQQAFGLADIYGDGSELGYISIQELVNNGVELDLHWQPKTIKQIRGKVAESQQATGKDGGITLAGLDEAFADAGWMVKSSGSAETTRNGERFMYHANLSAKFAMLDIWDDGAWVPPLSAAKVKSFTLTPTSSAKAVVSHMESSILDVLAALKDERGGAPDDKDQSANDRALFQSVIDGTVADILAPTLADDLEAAYNRHAEDSDMAALFEQAVNAYQTAMLAATANLS